MSKHSTIMVLMMPVILGFAMIITSRFNLPTIWAALLCGAIAGFTSLVVESVFE